MQAGITFLEIYLEVLETNALLNESKGNLEQAALERKNAVEVREALAWLKRHAEFILEFEQCGNSVLSLAEILGVDTKVLI